MRVELQILEGRQRSDNPVECCVCERRYVVGAVIALCYPLDGERAGEPVCPDCIEDGPEIMAESLEKQAYWNRRVADEAEELAAEGVEAPSIADFRFLEEVAGCTEPVPGFCGTCAGSSTGTTPLQKRRLCPILSFR